MSGYLVALGSSLVLGSCAPACIPTNGPAPVEAVKPPCPGVEVLMEEDMELGCDLVGGVHTLVIIWPGADPEDEPYYTARCDDFGGDFEVRVVDGGPTAACWNADF